MLWKEPIDSNADGNKDIFLKLFFYNMIIAFSYDLLLIFHYVERFFW